MIDKNTIRREILEKVREFYEAGLVDKKDFIPGKDLAHYAGRVHDSDELITLVDSSLDFWLTSGRFTEEFETGLSDFLRAENVLTVNSGSSANLVALSTLTSPKLMDRRVCPGDEVIKTALFRFLWMWNWGPITPHRKRSKLPLARVPKL